MGTMRVTAEWALWGKQPDDRGYGLLQWSPGRLSGDDFGEIMGRFSAGTPDELPEITLSWFGRDENAHLGLAIQEWSGQQDKLGRDIAVTRYYCVPYAELARGPVSYEAMYKAFNGHRLPLRERLTVSLPVLEPNSVATRVTDQAMGTAALLMTRDPVCVVGAEALPLDERLRFIDTVAALLPYGMRSRFSASTWTSSTAQHRIRLSFAAHPRDRAHTVDWGERVRIPIEADAARNYLVTLADHPDMAELVRCLAAEHHPLGFRDEDVIAALALADRSGRSRLSLPVPLQPTRPGADDVLTDCADALDEGDAGRVATCLARLERLLFRPPSEEERARYQTIIKDRRMLAAQRPAVPELRRRVYSALLHCAFGPWLTGASLHRIEDAAGGLHRPLLLAMRAMPMYDTSVRLQIGIRLGPEELREMLADLSADELAAAATQSPPDRWTVEAACEELVSRAEVGDCTLAPALYTRDYLAPELQSLYPERIEVQCAKLRDLLRAAYGPTLGRGEFLEIIGGRPGLPTKALLTAAVLMYGQGAREVLADAFVTALTSEANLQPKTRRHVEQALAAPPRAPSGRPDGPPGRRSRWPRRRGVHVEECPQPVIGAERGLQERDERYYASPLNRWLIPLVLLSAAVAVTIVLLAIALG